MQTHQRFRVFKIDVPLAGDEILGTCVYLGMSDIPKVNFFSRRIVELPKIKPTTT